MSLIVRPIEANLTHDVDWVQRMDPYLKIFLGGETHQSSVAKDGGKNPYWQDTLYFSSPDSQLIIQVWDSNLVYDDIIAQGTYNTQQLYNYPNYLSDNEWVDLFFHGRPAGRILLGLQLQQGAGNAGFGNQGGFGGGGFGGNHNNGGW